MAELIISIISPEDRSFAPALLRPDWEMRPD